ncbi:NADH dehydrogenase-like protein [Planctomycetes bacterium Pan216]|uniref:NADH dehydrogenase-like protein n=1 Tax=Kolteria novifilia TaxID=2527975 RepID=A0A518B7U7_9BACT|nr:NADH dehydrogenase-like protein [Planctomycetes bacterium Pan216]
MASPQKRVVILGGGFAGVYTAMYLERALPKSMRDQVEISLVSRENYIVFQPLLPEVVSGSIELLHAISPIRRLVRQTRLYSREIQNIDLDEKTIHLFPGCRPQTATIRYDHLVIGLGTQLDYSRVPGMREHSIPFRYLGDALRLRNHLVNTLEEADNETDPENRRELLTFVVAGGGFSGVECIAEMNDLLRSAIKAYRNIQEDDLTFILLQSGDRILPEMEEDLAGFAHRILQNRGVEIRLRTRMTAVTATSALSRAKDSDQTEAIPTRTVVATVPSGPHPLLAELDCEKRRGRIAVDRQLRLLHREGVWAVGDCAFIPTTDRYDDESDPGSPPTAQHALRQAKTCAQNIAASLQGKELKTFSFAGLGKLGSLGRMSAVASVMGVKVSGVLAWILWRAIYVSKMPGLDRKIRVLFDWLLDWMLPRDIAELRIFQPDSVIREHFERGQFVFDQGDFGDKVYFIVDGKAEIIIDGKVIDTLETGQTFGEIALYQDQPRRAAVRAATPLDCVTVSRAAFENLLAHVPGVADAISTIVKSRLDGPKSAEAAIGTTEP